MTYVALRHWPLGREVEGLGPWLEIRESKQLRRASGFRSLGIRGLGFQGLGFKGVGFRGLRVKGLRV